MQIHRRRVEPLSCPLPNPCSRELESNLRQSYPTGDSPAHRTNSQVRCRDAPVALQRMLSRGPLLGYGPKIKVVLEWECERWMSADSVRGGCRSVCGEKSASH